MFAATKSTQSPKSADAIPEWKGLMHAGYDPERALRTIVAARADSIGLPNPIRIKLGISARLRGDQDRGYAISVHRAKFTENPIRAGLVTNCLLYEIEHRDELKNARGNNFRDLISKTILEAGRIEAYEHPGRKSEEATLCRNSLPKIIRARVEALALPEIERWLMEGRQESVTNYFYRVLLDIAQKRSVPESRNSIQIMTAGVRSIFYPADTESNSDRLRGLMRLNPMFLNASADILVLRGESKNSYLGSDAAFIREKLAHQTAQSASIEKWLADVPVLDKFVRAL